MSPAYSSATGIGTEIAVTHPYFVALFESAKTVHASLDPNIVLQEIARNCAEAVGCRGSAIRLLDPERERLMLSAAHGLSRDYLAKGPVYVESSQVDRQALEGRPVVIEDAQSDPRFQYREEAQEESIRSVLCVPLMLDERGIGVLRVYSEEPRRFDQGEVDLLTAMAVLGSIAIRNAQMHMKLRDEMQSLEEFVTRSW
jgi:signal transduction protein with GAF and PtsI domain